MRGQAVRVKVGGQYPGQRPAVAEPYELDVLRVTDLQDVLDDGADLVHVVAQIVVDGGTRVDVVRDHPSSRACHAFQQRGAAHVGYHAVDRVAVVEQQDLAGFFVEHLVMSKVEDVDPVVVLRILQRGPKKLFDFDAVLGSVRGAENDTKEG